MGQTDLAVRFLSERYLRELVPALLSEHRVLVHEVLRTEVKIVERKNDEVVRAEIDGVPTVLHVELQSSHESDLFLRMLTYHALLAGKHAPLPVRSLLVYLMPTPPATIERGFCDDQVLFACDVFCPWEHPIGLEEVRRCPVLAPLAALTPGIQRSDLEPLCQAVEGVSLPASERGDLLAFTYLLAGRRFPKEVTSAGRKA